MEKLLEDAQIKLSVVASDIFGVSGRDMMAALIAGERDPKVLAQLARSRMRVKIPQLEEAFVGRFDRPPRVPAGHHAGPDRRDQRRHRRARRPDRGAGSPLSLTRWPAWTRSPGSGSPPRA